MESKFIQNLTKTYVYWMSVNIKMVLACKKKMKSNYDFKKTKKQKENTFKCTLVRKSLNLHKKKVSQQ